MEGEQLQLVTEMAKRGSEEEQNRLGLRLIQQTLHVMRGIQNGKQQDERLSEAAVEGLMRSSSQLCQWQATLLQHNLASVCKAPRNPAAADLVERVWSAEEIVQAMEVMKSLRDKPRSRVYQMGQSSWRKMAQEMPNCTSDQLKALYMRLSPYMATKGAWAGMSDEEKHAVAQSPRMRRPLCMVLQDDRQQRMVDALAWDKQRKVKRKRKEENAENAKRQLATAEDDDEVEKVDDDDDDEEEDEDGDSDSSKDSSSEDSDEEEADSEADGGDDDIETTSSSDSSHDS